MPFQVKITGSSYTERMEFTAFFGIPPFKDTDTGYAGTE